MNCSPYPTCSIAPRIRQPAEAQKRRHTQERGTDVETHHSFTEIRRSINNAAAAILSLQVTRYIIHHRDRRESRSIRLTGADKSRLRGLLFCRHALAAFESSYPIRCQSPSHPSLLSFADLGLTSRASPLLPRALSIMSSLAASPCHLRCSSASLFM